MWQHHFSTIRRVIGVAGTAALLAACSDSFDNPFDGTCSASVGAPVASQPGDPAGSTRYPVMATCVAGPTFGTLRSDGEWVVAPSTTDPDSVVITFSGAYTGTSASGSPTTLNMTFAGVGAIVVDEGITFVGTESFGGGTDIFDGCSGSARVTNGVFGPGAQWEFNGTLTANNNEFEW
jgi:hypothetical protein